MKEIFIAIIAIVLIAFAASYGLKTMNWTAANIYRSTDVRL
jgi:uncharacterized protein YxeA